MSNRLDSNPIVVDTTDTTVTGPLSIVALKWVGTQNTGKDIAQNDKLTIKDTNAAGNILIQCKAQVSAPGQEAYSVYFGSPWNVSGLFVDDLDGGELQIFLK